MLITRSDDRIDCDAATSVLISKMPKNNIWVLYEALMSIYIDDVEAIELFYKKEFLNV